MVGPMPDTFRNTHSRLPLYQQLRDHILSNIAAGHWPPGEAIPTESALTRHYGVAIGTVRRAVDTLVQEGLLERSQGRGTFVRRPDFDRTFLRFFRQRLEEGAPEVPEGRVLSRTRQAATSDVAAALGCTTGDDVIHLVRLRLIDDTPLLLEDIWLPLPLFEPLLELPFPALGPLLYPIYEKRCGCIVASARETLTIGEADVDTAHRLAIGEGDPVAIIERLATGYDTTPLELRRSRGAARTFRYQIDIH